MSKILLAGDSTVAGQPHDILYDPALCRCGWGRLLYRFLKPGVMVENYAAPGFTVERFRKEGPYDALRASLRPGDVVMFQFGHNDQKVPHLQAGGGYFTALLAFVEEVRAAGAHPVLVTPPARNSWRGDTGAYNDLLAPYAEAARQTGVQTATPVVDLNAVSTAWIKKLGLQGAKAWFFHGDYSHPNGYGGHAWARMVAQACLKGAHSGFKFIRPLVEERDKWPDLVPPAGAADPVYGWLTLPRPRCLFEGLAGEDAPLRCADVLDIALRGYGYFAVNGGDEHVSVPMRAARQNGYLPRGLAKYREPPDRPATLDEFRMVLLMACRGRNRLPEAAEDLSPRGAPDGTLSRRQAVAYALALEAVATGCRVEEVETCPQTFGPEGS